MFDQLTARLDFHANALLLRAQRQEVIASNIANADTPGYVARDFDFASALRAAGGGESGHAASVGASGVAATDARHLRNLSGQGGAAGAARLGYAVQTQPSVDGNSVDLDRERAAFTDNAVRYESTLRFINGHVKTMLAAIQGQ